ncbi:hypothetical protein BS47DRAFT_584787 [Hydnum rufescens UP504]|uniref:Uncharacterized protein n=1 Tax=Hydnum rufescens UP504 TaxID=1448309 RepID=A0A9P6B428_9AGAM|nr:hypothetical protein BS47DRAFT_584787 [Hydnum rufescens UP504]
MHVISEGPPLVEQSVLEGHTALAESESAAPLDKVAGGSLPGATHSVTEETASIPETEITPKGPPSADQSVFEGHTAPVGVGLVPLESESATLRDKEAGRAHDTAPVDGFVGLPQTAAEEASSTPTLDVIPEVSSLVQKSASGGDGVEIVPLESEPNTKSAGGVQDAISVPLAAVVPPVAGEIASTSKTDTPEIVSSVLNLDRGDDDAIAEGALVPPESTGPAEKAQPAASVQPLAEETAQTLKKGTAPEIPSVQPLVSEGVEIVPPESGAITFTGASEPEFNGFATDPILDSTVAPGQLTADNASASQTDLNDRLAKTAEIDVTLGAESTIKDVESTKELDILPDGQNEEVSDARVDASPDKAPNITAPVEGSDKVIDGKDDIIQPLGPSSAETPLPSIQDEHGSNVQTESTGLGKVPDPSAKRDEESPNDAPASTSSQPDPVVPPKSGSTEVLSPEPNVSTVPLEHHDTAKESIVNNEDLTEPTSIINAPSPLPEVPLVEPPTHTEVSAPPLPGDTVVPFAKPEQENIAGAFIASAPIIATMGVANLAFHIPSDPLVADPTPIGEAKLDEHVDTEDQVLIHADEHEPRTDLGDTSVVQGISPVIPKNTDATEQIHSTPIPVSQLDEGDVKESNATADASIEVPDSASSSVGANIANVLELDLANSQTKPSVIEDLALSETQEPVLPANTGAETTIIGYPESVGPVHTADNTSVLEAGVPPLVGASVSAVVESTLSSEQSLPDSGAPLESTDAVATPDVASEETPVAQTAPEWPTTAAAPPTIGESTIVRPIVSGDDSYPPQDTPETSSDPLPESSKAPTVHTTVTIETPTLPEPITPAAPQVLRIPILDDFHTDSSIAPSSPRSDLGVNAITDIGDDTRSEVSRASEVPVPPTSPPAHDYDQDDEDVNINLLRELWKKEPSATPPAETSLSQTPTDEKQPIEALPIAIQESEASTPEPFLPADKSSPDITATVLDPDTGIADNSTREAPTGEDNVLARAPDHVASGAQTAILTPVAPVAAEQAGIKTILADSSETHVWVNASTSAGAPSGSAVVPVPEIMPVVPQPPLPETVAHESKVPEVTPANSESPSDLPAPPPSEVGQTRVEPEAIDSHERHALATPEDAATVVSETIPEQQTKSEVVATDPRVAASDGNTPAALHRADGGFEQPKEITAGISPIESPPVESHGGETLSEHNYELASATLADVRRRSVPPPVRYVLRILSQ